MADPLAGIDIESLDQKYGPGDSSATVSSPDWIPPKDGKPGRLVIRSDPLKNID